MDEVADSFRVNFFAFACSQVEDSTEERKKKKKNPTTWWGSGVVGLWARLAQAGKPSGHAAGQAE